MVIPTTTESDIQASHMNTTLKEETPEGTRPTSTVAISEDRSQFLIRYGIEKYRFAQVLSSVTSHSVLLLGVEGDENRKPAGTESLCWLIALIPLVEPVDPNRTSATFDGNELVLKLVKCGDQFEARAAIDTKWMARQKDEHGSSEKR